MTYRFANEKQMEIGFTVLRIATGLVFAAHGYQKWFGMGIGGTSGFFGSVGIPLPEIAAMLVATLEFGGGIALALGILTRFIAAAFIIDMLGAIHFVHWKNGFFLPTGIEFVGMLMISSLALALGGPGAFAVDRMFGNRKNSTDIR
jgi:putative oxidoreductase